MENEKETKTRLLKCAMKEFSEKGYMKASLRSICREAGVTTGALYFFFKDKEDLFGSLIEEPLSILEKAIKEHFTDEIAVAKSHGENAYDIEKLVEAEEMEDDIAVSRVIVGFLFQYREAFDLLLTKAQGSKYENYVDEMIDMVESHYMRLYMTMKGYRSLREMTKEDKFIVHWMSSDQISVFIHIFTHCKDVKEAEKQMKRMIAYIVGGWFAVIRMNQ